MSDKSNQTLRPIPIPNVDNLEDYSINCIKCERFWIVNAEEILMYEAFQKNGDTIEKVRICFECGAEKLKQRFLQQHESNDFKNQNAWLDCKVLISEFKCCCCGNSCDVNFKVTDRFIGKIPFRRFVFCKRHKFCYLCFENVKDGEADTNGRVILDPKQCRRDHSKDDEDSDVELMEEDLIK